MYPPKTPQMPFQPTILNTVPVCHGSVSSGLAGTPSALLTEQCHPDTPLLQNKPKSGRRPRRPECLQPPKNQFCKTNPSPVGALADRNASIPKNPILQNEPPLGTPSACSGPIPFPLSPPQNPILQNKPNSGRRPRRPECLQPPKTPFCKTNPVLSTSTSTRTAFLPQKTFLQNKPNSPKTTPLPSWSSGLPGIAKRTQFPKDNLQSTAFTLQPLFSTPRA